MAPEVCRGKRVVSVRNNANDSHIRRGGTVEDVPVRLARMRLARVYGQMDWHRRSPNVEPTPRSQLKTTV